MTSNGRAASACKRCGAQIVFGVTVNQRRIPMDVEPNPAGSLAVSTDPKGQLRAHRISEALPAQSWEQIYMPHFATCTAGSGGRP